MPDPKDITASLEDLAQSRNLGDADIVIVVVSKPSCEKPLLYVFGREVREGEVFGLILQAVRKL